LLRPAISLPQAGLAWAQRVVAVLAIFVREQAPAVFAPAAQALSQKEEMTSARAI